MQNSIRRRLTVAFIIVAIGPLLLVGIVLAARSFNVQLQQASFFEETVALRVSTEVTGFVERLEAELQSVVKALPGNSPRQKANLMAFMPSFPATVEDLILVDREGISYVQLSRLNVLAPDDHSHWDSHPAFTVPKENNQIYYGAIEVNPLDGDPTMLISFPVANVRSGIVDEVLIARVRFKPIWDLLGNIQLNSGESVYIVDAVNRVIAHRNPSVVLVGTNFAPAGSGLQKGLDNTNVVMAARSLTFGDQVFLVVAERAVVNALDLAIQTVLVTVALLIVAIALASLTGFQAARTLVRPIQALAGVANDLGKQSESFDPKRLETVAARTDELGQLARVFQNMGQQVATREATLKKQVLELKIEIDESKKQSSIKQIVDTEYFRDLEARANDIRASRRARVERRSESGSTAE